MNRRHLMLKAGTVVTASLLPGCGMYGKSSPTKPRELRADTGRPIIGNKPNLQNKWSNYATLITERKGMERFNQNISGAVNDWKPIEFPEQFVSVVSVVVPVRNTLKPVEIELEENECRYEFRVDESESTDSDLPDPFLFNVVHLWDLNGHSAPTGVSVHVNKGDG